MSPSAQELGGLAEAAGSSDAERACLAKLRELTGAPGGEMELHCLRVFEIAVELAGGRRPALDREALLCAAWLHDAGLYPPAASQDAYVADGRRLLTEVLAPFDWPPSRLALAGDAVECHHELRPQWSRGTEVELLRRADLVDVSGGLVRFGLTRGWLGALGERVPRRGMYREIGRLVARALRERPTSVPRIFLRRL